MQASIIIITANRKTELARCLASIERSSPKFSFEVIVVANGDSSPLAMFNKMQNLTTIYLENSVTPATARNLAIKRTNGEYLFFLDDDAFLPEDYFLHFDFKEGWDVLGGPDHTPPESNSFQVQVGMTLRSPICMGPTFERHKKSNENVLKQGHESNLILCNLWIKKEVLTKNRLEFDEFFFRNEENVLIKKLQQLGANIRYNPSIYVYHDRKKNIQELYKSVFKSGFYRAHNFFLNIENRELIYFFPLIVSSLGIIIFLTYPQFFLFLFFVFSFLVFYQQLKNEQSITLTYLGIHIITLLSYSAGLGYGVLKIWRFFPLNTKNSRID